MITSFIFFGFASKNNIGYTNRETKNCLETTSSKWNLVEGEGVVIGVSFECRCDPAHLASVRHFTLNLTLAVRKKSGNVSVEA